MFHAATGYINNVELLTK